MPAVIAPTFSPSPMRPSTLVAISGSRVPVRMWSMLRAPESTSVQRDGATMPYTTSRRMFLLSTPLGEDDLLIQQFEGSEGLSRLFEFRLLMPSVDDSVAAGELIGKSGTIALWTTAG